MTSTYDRVPIGSDGYLQRDLEKAANDYERHALVSGAVNVWDNENKVLHLQEGKFAGHRVLVVTDIANRIIQVLVTEKLEFVTQTHYDTKYSGLPDLTFENPEMLESHFLYDSALESLGS